MKFIRKILTELSLLAIGASHAFRYWLSYPDRPIHGVRVIVVEDRKVLLVSHWFAPWAWTLPGGGVNKNEEADHAAMREVEEETGFKVNSLAGEIGTYQGSFGKHDLIRVYYTGDISGSLAMKPNIEIMARSWFDLDNLPEELSPANLRRILAYRDGVRGETGKW